MTTINIDSTIQQAGVTAYDSGGGIYTLYVATDPGVPTLPTHYIQAVNDDGTATAYVTTETAPATTAKEIVANFSVLSYNIGELAATATTDSTASAEIAFSLLADVREWAVAKIRNHTQQATARILSQYRG
jgi:hypothetical protein